MADTIFYFRDKRQCIPGPGILGITSVNNQPRLVFPQTGSTNSRSLVLFSTHSKKGPWYKAGDENKKNSNGVGRRGGRRNEEGRRDEGGVNIPEYEKHDQR